MHSPTAWRRAAICVATFSCIALIAPVSLAAPAPNLAALDTAATHLAIGDSGPAVIILQSTLNDWGIHSPVDGHFTQTTADAVTEASQKGKSVV